MEVQVAGRVIDDGSIFLASFVLLNMVQHSGISKHESRLPRMLSNDRKTKCWIWQEKNILSGMVVTNQLCKHSEELRELSVLNLLPTNDQDP